MLVGNLICILGSCALRELPDLKVVLMLNFLYTPASSLQQVLIHRRQKQWVVFIAETMEPIAAPTTCSLKNSS